MTHESASQDLENSTFCFSDFDISSELKKGIKELGYTSPTEFQKGVFDNFQKGRNIIGDGQSNYGKSLAFALPIIAKIEVANKRPQALIICESAMLADIAQKECRALSRHMGVLVGSGQGVDCAHLLVTTVDELAKFSLDDVMPSLHTIFFDGLSAKNVSRALSILPKSFSNNLQVLIFGDTTLAAFKENMPKIIENAAIINNNDQPKITAQALHYYVQAKDAEPKPRALLGAIEILKPKSALITCNESQECDLLSRYLSRYGYKTVIVSEENNRHGLADALLDMASNNMVIVQNSLLSNASLEKVLYMFNYDMFDRAQNYEHNTQFAKQALGRERHIVNILTNRELGLLGPIKAQCQIEFSEISLPSENEVIDLCAKRIQNALLKEASEVELAQYEVLSERIFSDEKSAPVRSLLLRNYLLRTALKPTSREHGDTRDRTRIGRGSNDRRRISRGDRGQERHEQRPMKDRRENINVSDETSNIERDVEGLEFNQTETRGDGITRLYVTLGRKDGLFDLASLAQFLSEKSAVDLGHFSGSGMIRDTSAHIEVDDDVAEDIIKAVNGLPRESTEGSEDESTIVCERARMTAQRHHRRPPQRRRHFSRRPN